MPLTSGSRLGPYEILSPIGAGGMGEVYRARDTRLGRGVAIKVLPAAFAKDAERLARFRREAHALASLNHPHIAAIYGLEEAEGVESLVLELVEGETLAERLARGALPVDEALPIARQIAEALEAAHERSIVHRDLKPANVKLTPVGQVKVLDFGLAKALTGDASSPDVSHSPTITAAATQAGVVIGTAAYMSPEQARGKSTDKRADIWAFGAVLYEMLTGRRLFAGETVSDILAAVLRADLDWSLLPQETPPTIRRLLARCLDRDAKNRLHDAADARIEIEEAIAERRSGPSLSGVLPAAPARSRRSLGFIAATAAGLALAFFAGWRLARGSAHTVAIHSIIPLPENTRLAGWASPVVAFSRDGRKVAFVATKEGSLQQLYIHHLDRGETQLVPDSETAEGPFFSPDGDWVAFATDVSSTRYGAGQLKKFSLATSLTQSVCAIPDYFGGDWAEDGTITFVGMERKGIWTVPAAGGAPASAAPSVRVKGREEPHGVLWPQRLSGEKVLVSDEDSSRWGDVGVLDLASRELRYAAGPALSGRYIRTGHLLYLDPQGTLFAVPFDPARGEKKGAPVAAVKNVTISANLSGAFAVSATGSLVYATGYVRDSANELSTFVRIDRAGALEPIPIAPGVRGRAVRLSPDRQRLAVVGQDYTLWIYDLRRNTGLKLPSGRVRALDSPVWTPDGQRVAFGGDVEGTPGWKIFWQKADGSAEPELLVKEGIDERHPGSFTPDGRALLYTSLGEGEARGLWVQPIGGASAPHRLIRGALRQPMVSPSGRWIAYGSTESGATEEVFAERFPELGHKVQISIGGGSQPVWSRDGRQIFYRRGKAFYAISIAEGSELAVGSPKLLFEKAEIQGYDVAPDGKGFLAIYRPPEFGVIRELHLVTNWFEELKRLAPVRGEK